MSLPGAPDKYDKDNESRTRALIGQSLDETFKRGSDLQLDRERLILKDQDDGTLYAITIQSGVIVPEAL